MPIASAAVFNDGQDQWTLLERKLVNRQLFDQIDGAEQGHRFGRDMLPLAAAGDIGLGSQVPLPNSARTRFHGYYLLDSYLALLPVS